MHKALLLLGCTAGVLGYETEGNVLKLGQSDFDQAIKEYPDMLVKFYAPWCGHCKNLAQPYLQTADLLKQQQSPARLAEVDCTIHKSLCQKYAIRGYPTLNWFSGDAEPVKYSNSRTKQAISTWINEQIEAKKAKQVKEEEIVEEKVPEEPKVQFTKEGKLLKLTNKDFELAKNQFDFLFVKFFAPWCGHCVKMGPAWTELANANTNEKVAIAQVDCTVERETCAGNQVRGYPTVKLFVKGNEPIPYQKARTLEQLQGWLAEQVQTVIPGAIPTKAAQQKAQQL